jgi:[citrate (pro-3S)-lyase] ligase
MIFAVNIAPPMGIRKRFVGEEPFSAITNHYHRQMKEILPRNGVDVVEIPRLTFMEEKSKKKYIISASAVRRLVKQQRWDELRKYVPESTFTCLKEMESSINL